MADAEAIKQEAAEAEQEETTLVRIVEWMDWIPAEKSKVAGADLHMTHGVTSFQTQKKERLLELGVSGTGRNYEWDEEEKCDECDEGSIDIGNQGANEDMRSCPKCEGTGKITRKFRHGLYAFQAILAQNVTPSLAKALQYAQARPMLEELARDQAKGRSGRDKRGDLFVVQQPANRKERRDRKKKR